MSIQNLVEMANDIGNYFAAETDHARAVADVAQHLKRFWEPRMRRKLAEHIAATGGEGLSPLVLEAAASLARAA